MIGQMIDTTVAGERVIPVSGPIRIRVGATLELDLEASRREARLS